MFQVKKILNNIIDNAYPNSDKIKNYKNFYIEIINKRRKSFHGDYNPQTGHIRLFNLSRSDASLAATSIHEVAHHIDYCNRGLLLARPHDKAFYEIYETLLKTALDMGVFTAEEFLNSIRDASDSNKIASIVENYTPKSSISKSIIFSVQNGYKVKELLKNNGYSFDSVYKRWEKETPLEDVDKEKAFLSNIEACYEERPNNKLLLSKNIYIVAQEGSFLIKDFLKQQGFTYNSKLKSWKKKGRYEDYDKYKRKYPDVKWKIID